MVLLTLLAKYHDPPSTIVPVYVACFMRVRGDTKVTQASIRGVGFQGMWGAVGYSILNLVPFHKYEFQLFLRECRYQKIKIFPSTPKY